ncbi:MAG: hypothetical protein LBG60_08050 [Bifidobacteriaceae bacterium]|nr:hypothetical protein [Bifidobacteriaceae bacterium]
MAQRKTIIEKSASAGADSSKPSSSAHWRFSPSMWQTPAASGPQAAPKITADAVQASQVDRASRAVKDRGDLSQAGAAPEARRSGAGPAPRSRWAARLSAAAVSAKAAARARASGHQRRP